jgi:NAD(P)H-flavin reductase
MVFTIKNYKQEKGLSFKFFETDQRAEYKIKGPMGKGLAPAQFGTHIAFCAGTGALCFVDIMAHIALAVMGQLSPADIDAGSIDIRQFSMHMYASFPSRREGVAYELMEALHNYCLARDLQTFVLHPRLSKEKINPARWDNRWIENTLLQYNAPAVQRVWVCGPPFMNEQFDRTLMDMRSRLPANNNID